MATAASALYQNEPSNTDFSLSGAKSSTSRTGASITFTGAAMVAAASMAAAAPNPGESERTFPAHAGGEFYVDDRALLIDELREYSSLEAGWDGHDEDVVPRREAIDEAILFVENLPPFVDLPEPMVSSDGQVGLFWQEPHLYLDIGFRGQGECSFFGKSGDLKIKGKEPISASDAIPAKVLSFLAQVDHNDEVLERG